MSTALIGHVSLVGAGPGDVDLLTLRAVRRLGEADVVFHDALCSLDARALAPEARWSFVGKRAGAPSISQESLNRLLIREARRGSCVVRLKAGDPFVLGRGGEEAQALVEAGIPFEVIPGVSAAVAAPALAGIPLTHRGLASGFVVVSGHSEEAYRPVLDGLAPGSATVVVMMGLGARHSISRHLIARGWPSSTPAAIVLGAATPHAWRWLGDLGALPAAEFPQDRVAMATPGMLVVGAVVALAAELRPQQDVAQDVVADVLTGALSR